MQFKLLKNDNKYQWTEHVKGKMLHYGISASLIKRIVRFPKRKEEGIAPKTIAVMAPTSSKKQEVWVMYQELGQKPISDLNAKRYMLNPKLKIISAWRYPGVSPVGKPIPIPDEIRQELDALIN